MQRAALLPEPEIRILLPTAGNILDIVRLEYEFALISGGAITVSPAVPVGLNTQTPVRPTILAHLNSRCTALRPE
jgi:hypothetical protein